MYQIANEELVLEVTEQGAEMKSLKDRASGREYLWCGGRKILETHGSGAVSSGGKIPRQ